MPMYTVGELAKATGVTVRTLHHYDELGLVSPSGRSPAGYRLYDDGDVLRLRQVLFYRELGFPLDEIGAVLDDPSFDRIAALREQRAELATRRARVDGMIAAIDRVLDDLGRGAALNPADVPSLFDGFAPETYADEAQARWGHTAEYAEAARRTRSYGPAEWQALKAEGDGVYRALAALLQAGAAVDDARVQAAVEAHRAHIARWFYPCSRALHRGLGNMYVADPRFTANIDRVAPGLAAFLRAAILAAPDDE